MFITNGSRKPKPVFTNEIVYTDNPSSISPFSKDKVIAPTADNFKAYFSCKNSRYTPSSMLSKYGVFSKILPEDKFIDLMELKNIYNAEIVILTCFEKKTKNLRVSFYIVPNEAIAKIEDKDTSLFGNKRIYLKSNYVFPSILVGSPYKKEHIEKNLDFSNHKIMSYEKKPDYENKKSICIRESSNVLLRDRTVFFNKKDFPCSGNYKVLLGDIEYILHVDEKKFGTKEDPFYFLYNARFNDF